MADKNYKEISLKKFLSTFTEIHTTDKDRKFCFVLGAGASVSSGIPTGATLASKWLKEIEANEEPELYKEWLEENSIDSKNSAISYPKIYQKRYEDDPKSGFSFIESLMASKTPSYGYSVLAQILATTRHNVVITTNFDDLLQEALYTYTDKRPLVCGHESLAGFAKAKIERPLIIKIHRDRFLSPINDNQIEEIKEQWLQPLSSIFSSYTPIFIGYGGNDGSLMDFLKEVREFENIFWIEREGKNKTQPNETVLKLLKDKDGKLVFSQGFDDLMFLMQDKIGLSLLDDDIIKVANTRREKYQKEVGEILKRKKDTGNNDEKIIANELFEKAEEKGWWYYELKAQAAKTNEERNKIYNEATLQLPSSHELCANYALFLNEIKDYDNAEKYYLKALDINKESDSNNGNYAIFLKNVRKDYDKAEEYYLRALAINPDEVNNGNYAILLSDVRKDYDKAEIHYLRAIEINPESNANGRNYGNYAVLLNEKRKDYDKAEKYYLKALNIMPDDAIIYGNYAEFLDTIRKDYDKAEKYYLKALSIDSDQANINCNYAVFLYEIKKDYKNCKKLLLKALRGKPEDPDILANYAEYLRDVEKDYNKSKINYELSLKYDPDNESHKNEYKKLLDLMQKKSPAKQGSKKVSQSK